MVEAIDYSGLSEKAIAALKEINKFGKEFSKFEMIPAVKEEMDEILELSSGKTIRMVLGGKKLEKKNSKETYADLISNLLQIEDDIAEIEFLTSDMMRKIYDLSEEDKNEFFDTLGIDPIDKEDLGISDERKLLLSKMSSISGDMTRESEEFYSEELEEYIDVKRK